MPVIALEVQEDRDHPNADALRIYRLGAPGRPPIQVVANRDHIYRHRDVVAVALVGTVLNDGTKIRTAKLRGAESKGMILERVDDAPGTDVTSRFIEPPDDAHERDSPAQVIKWTSIELLPHVRKQLDDRRETLGDRFAYPKITYRAKVKLDGTNGGVQIWPSGQVFAQSRSRLIDQKSDNLDFAAWVDGQRAYFQNLASPKDTMVIFGEWCGAGIQKRTAISKIDRRVFAVFAIQYGDHQATDATLEVDPTRIRASLPEHPDIFVLPWHGDAIVLDFADRSVLESAAESINREVSKVEACDPWVQEIFGVSGVGEGVVLYPAPPSDAPVPRDDYTALMFKAKGDKHQVVRQKKPAQLDPEVAASVAHFVNMFVTPARLEQGVQEACAGRAELQKMGDFLRWVGQDVKKESKVELEASHLVWKDVSKAVTTAASTWYKAAVNQS